MASVRGRKCAAGCTCGRHRQTMTQCAQCGESFVRSRSKIYCSRACAGRSYHRRLTATCQTCGDTFDFAAARKTAKYCGRVCAAVAATTAARTERACLQCGTTFVVKVSVPAKFCSHACRDASMRTGAALPCVVCGSTFYATPSRINARFCSVVCAGAAKRLHEPGESKRLGHRARKARKMAVASEPYTNAEIAQRDGWRCGICGGKVDPALSWPDPWSISIDHVVPFAEGGDDTKANVQLAHLRCNVVKGAKALPRGEQLRLIG